MKGIGWGWAWKTELIRDILLNEYNILLSYLFAM
jgi:hypothetical protein